MKTFAVRHLNSGGLITNYNCPSRCAHCLYACGPGRLRDYMTSETARECLTTIRRMGCSSIHIGGGEPFLNLAGLQRVMELANEIGVSVEYVETNSAWFKDVRTAESLLRDLKKSGLNTLLVSISPFHNQFIPFNKVKGVIQACGKSGISVFPWIEQFIPEVDSFDDSRPHSPPEYTSRFGQDYFGRLPGRYWVHYGGRAVFTFADVFEATSVKKILDQSTPCTELLDTSHFHIDLYGNFIPGLCSGLGFDHLFLGEELSRREYPVITTLFERGPRGLVDLARKTTDFQPDDAYLNKCHLCNDARRHMVRAGWEGKDLTPREYYQNLELKNGTLSH